MYIVLGSLFSTVITISEQYAVENHLKVTFPHVIQFHSFLPFTARETPLRYNFDKYKPMLMSKVCLIH